ncbi:winged helix-turn-helix transcriptional regulator [Photobacterium angustum]|uniref:Putative transcriptional regulator n=1 Tax=Photobacterium angustum (strain S14 / CCUG 15956) TaxID=314292 RepID=Q1ZV17_PHOAS|nr:winged helix-turn-helix transcriptional regulator [Photobacterium angustum]EAS66243.1 putative transcriptional regulator [Photobacterium angustum S14]
MRSLISTFTTRKARAKTNKSKILLVMEGGLWQLCSGGACTFRELQNRCESISPAVLNSRIKELRQAKLIEKGELGYQPTELGQEVISSIYPLKSLAEQWVESLNDIEK